MRVRHVSSRRTEDAPVVLQVVYPRIALSLAVDTGATNMAGFDGLVSERSVPRDLLVASPNATTLTYVNGSSTVARWHVVLPAPLHLKLIVASVDVGDGLDGLLGLGGIRRLQRDHDLRIDWAAGAVHFGGGRPVLRAMSAALPTCRPSEMQQ